MTISVLKEKLVIQAIETVRDLNKKYYEDSSKKKPLLEDEEKSTLYLQVLLKKIPKSRLVEMIKMNLPHSLVKDTDEVCLITGDLDKRNRKAEIEPDILHYKTLLDKHGVKNISEVITLRQLRTEYKPYEAKQKLLAAFDVFLADNRITECLPRVLGKHFFKKRKFPIQINLKTTNLKQQVEKALSTKVFYITGHGNCCASEVAYLDMDDSEILENVMAVAESLSKNVPGSWCNVMGIYLKTARSKAIPIYVDYDSPNGVQLPEKNKESDFIIDELNTIPDVAKVKVHSDGRVETVHIKQNFEASFVETNDSNTEESNYDSKLQGIKDESNNMENFETEPTKQANSKEEESFTKKSMKQEPVSPNQSPEKIIKQVKSEEKTKPLKQKKKSIQHKPVSPNQSLEKITKHVKWEDEIKPVKQTKKNIKQDPVSPDQSIKKIESHERKEKMALKRKRGNSESLMLDSELSVNDNETPVQATKKRKIEGINMKRYQSVKESQKSNRKKNQQRKKQKK